MLLNSRKTWNKKRKRKRRFSELCTVEGSPVFRNTFLQILLVREYSLRTNTVETPVFCVTCLVSRLWVATLVERTSNQMCRKQEY